MDILSAFRRFAGRVIESSKKGGLVGADQKRLGNLLERTGKRNLILAKGILSALDAGGAGRKDIERFGALLGKANQRILDDKQPFTDFERSELAAIFRRAYIPDGATARFTKNIDELLAEQISESIKERPVMALTMAKKKSTPNKEEDERKTLKV